LIGHYLEKPISKVTVVYQTFVSVIQQKLMVETLLPIKNSPPHLNPLPPIGGEGRVREVAIDYLYEPRKEEILSALLPRSLKARIYHILLESYAAELGARMNAMENATKNAKELMDILTLRANKTRQTMITKELSELVGCAEALN
jgi:F-type H+-transporting ATPase subunit gamma